MGALPVTAIVSRSVGSAALELAIAIATAAAAGLLGLAVNWTMLLLVLPLDSTWRAGVGILVFGLFFPMGWFLAAQPYAAAKAARRFYQRNRGQVVTYIAGALSGREDGLFGSPLKTWLGHIEALRARLDNCPRLLRPLLGLALGRIGSTEIAAALGGGSEPVPMRVALAVADRLEAELPGAASMVWFWIVVAGNLLAYIAILLE